MNAALQTYDATKTDCAPVMEDVALSVAVTERIPAVLRVTLKPCVPASVEVKV